MVLPTNQRGKETLFYIAVGKKMSHADRAWFAPLEQEVMHTVNDESNLCSFQVDKTWRQNAVKVWR